MKSLWGNRRIKICSAGLCWLFVMLLATTGGSDAAITVDGIEFDSMPAIFGMTWGNNVDYRAHLQSLPNRPFLCEDEDSFLHRNLKKQSTAPLIEPPADNLPIAVLASRGGCSFEEKARVAMNLLNVEIVIVYDDRERSSLVPMSASDPAAITVGMLFVSQSTGSQLKQMLTEQPANVTDSGGTTITMDARIPEYSRQPGYNQTEQWILAAMSGFFAVVACVGCLLVGAQTGILRPGGGRIGSSGERLLTEHQVLKLPMVDYGSRDGERACAICIEEFAHGDKLRQLPCQHEFHTECIIPWLTERHSCCPLCKSNVRPEEDSTRNSSTTHLINEWWRARSISFLAYYYRMVASEEDEAENAVQASQHEEESVNEDPAN